jgi:biopolymer transport protein ExbD
MKFPRNAKVFRGEINVAPLVSVLFLLVFFVLLAGLVYTPGVPIRLDRSPSGLNAVTALIQVTGTGVVQFADSAYPANDLPKLRRRLAELPAGSTVRVVSADTAPRGLVDSVRKIVEEAGRIELPVARGALGGTANRSVAVAVNFSGQFFFQNRLVNEDQLRKSLSDAVRARPDPVTLVVLADRAVDNATLIRLTVVASEAGIQELLLAARPGTFENTKIR